MITWLTENIGTIIVLVIVLACAGFAAWKIVRDRRNGKSSCGCGCANCAMHEMCHKVK
ncbi:MAG: FeoB-associated Cys-rich membrane protein [Lachnospiraceae bacterium]|nr:FeoB-associated Cys-rich membrane protein [Lachnospiraceae bacterium]